MESHNSAKCLKISIAAVTMHQVGIHNVKQSMRTSSCTDRRSTAASPQVLRSCSILRPFRRDVLQCDSISPSSGSPVATKSLSRQPACSCNASRLFTSRASRDQCDSAIAIILRTPGMFAGFESNDPVEYLDNDSHTEIPGCVAAVVEYCGRLVLDSPRDPHLVQSVDTTFDLREMALQCVHTGKLFTRRCLMSMLRQPVCLNQIAYPGVWITEILHAQMFRRNPAASSSSVTCTAESASCRGWERAFLPDCGWHSENETRTGWRPI